MAYDIFPDDMLTPDSVNDVILMLHDLPIDERRKKEAFAGWGNYVGMALTKEMYQQLLEDQYWST